MLFRSNTPVKFGERTRNCSPGQAGKEGPHGYWRLSSVTQSCPTLCDPMDHQPFLSMGILQARILEWVAMPSFRGSSQPRSPTLQVDSLPSEPPGKPKNTGAGSLSLLQGILPTQEIQMGSPAFLEDSLSPGHAGKEGPQLARTGASQGFPRAAAPVGPHL